MIFTSALYQNWAQAWFHLAQALIPVKPTALGVYPTLGMLWKSHEVKRLFLIEDYCLAIGLFVSLCTQVDDHVAWSSLFYFASKQEACFTLRASFLTRNMGRGQFALVMLIFFWVSLLWTSFWPWKLLHLTKALMCSQPFRLLVSR